MPSGKEKQIVNQQCQLQLLALNRLAEGRGCQWRAVDQYLRPVAVSGGGQLVSMTGCLALGVSVVVVTVVKT